MKPIKDLAAYLSVFFVICLILTPAGKAQTPEGYWGMEMGNSWTYRGTNPACGNCSWTVQTRVAPNPNVAVALPGFTTQYIEHFEENAFGTGGMPLDQKDWYAVNATEIRWLREESFEGDVGRWVTLTIDGGLRVGINPIFVGATWSETNISIVHDGVPMTLDSQFTVIGQGSITVPSGTYNAYQIHRALSVLALGGTVEERTQWFVPGLGFVKEVEVDPGAPGWIDTMNLVSTNVGTTFLDVDSGHFARPFIEQLSAAGITGGCTAANPRPSYCPEESITRGQMAVFIEAAIGNPPNPCTNRFGDVSNTNSFCGFIERMADDGITSGCGGGNFCPDTHVTRGQMAVFIEAALNNPPNICQSRFADVTGGPYCGFIERMADDGITSGCGGGNFCPDAPVTRAEMAVFLVAAPSLIVP